MRIYLVGLFVFVFLTSAALFLHAQTHSSPSLLTPAVMPSVGSSNQIATPITTAEWVALIQQQNACYAAAIQAQIQISQDGVASMKESYSSLISMVQVVGIIAGILTTLFGAWVFNCLQDLKKTREQALERLQVIESKNEEYSARLAEAKATISELFARVSACNEILEKARATLQKLDEVKDLEEKINEALVLANIAKARAQLLSRDANEQKYAIERLAQTKDPRVIPVLIDVLRDGNRSITVISEALYGLGNYGKIIDNNIEVLSLIVLCSRNPEKRVRRDAMDVMIRINPQLQLFKNRLIEIQNDDPDEELKDKARQCLQMEGWRI